LRCSGFTTDSTSFRGISTALWSWSAASEKTPEGARFLRSPKRILTEPVASCSTMVERGRAMLDSPGGWASMADLRSSERFSRMPASGMPTLSPESTSGFGPFCLATLRVADADAAV